MIKKILIIILSILIVLITIGIAYFTTEKNRILTKENERLLAQVKSQENAQLDELQKLYNDITDKKANYIKERDEYDKRKVVYSLFTAIIAENELLGTLILEKIVAIKSGSQFNFVVNQTEPNTELANTLKIQMVDKQKQIDTLKDEIEKAPQNLYRSTKTIQLLTEQLTMATLDRNYLINKYGLNTPFFSQQKTEIESKNTQDTNSLSDNNDNTEVIVVEEPTLKENLYDQAKKDSNNTVYDQWIVHKEMSLLGDRINVNAYTLADKELTKGAFGINETETLHIACNNKKTEIYVVFNQILESNFSSGMGSIEYKIDDGNIYKENWIKSDNLKGFFSPKPIDLIKNLMSANKISFRVQKYKVDAFLEASFNLDGLSQAIVPVQEACDWK